MACHEWLATSGSPGSSGIALDLLPRHASKSRRAPDLEPVNNPPQLIILNYVNSKPLGRKTQREIVIIQGSSDFLDTPSSLQYDPTELIGEFSPTNRVPDLGPHRILGRL